MLPDTKVKPLEYHADVAGMNRKEMPHLLPEGTWYNTFNFRFDSYITQTPQQTLAKEWTVTPPADVGMTAIVPLLGGATSAILVGFSGVDALKLDLSAPSPTTIVLPGPPVADNENKYRWQAVTSSGIIWATNHNAGVVKYDGTAATVAITAGTVYKAKYVEVYYDHLIIANLIDGVTELPLRIAYSDKGDFSDFDPLTTNEADFYDLDDNAYNALYGYGITGIRRIGDAVAIHTPGSIWVMQYVGFENGVMDFRERVTGIGCWLPWALVSFDRFHIFPGRDDFYVFDGATVQSIGQGIRDFFFNDLSTDPELRQKTWGTVDIDRQEVRWYYPSLESDGQIDKCLVFNWPGKCWYVEEGFNHTAVLYAGAVTRRTIDVLPAFSATIDGLVAVSATIDGLGVTSVLAQTVHSQGDVYADLFRELQPDEFSDSVTEDTPVGELESRDYDFRLGKEYVKDVHSLMVDCDLIHNTNQSDYGLDVFISTRDFFASAVEFKYFGTWKNNTFTKRMTNVNFAGKIVRFKFRTRNLANTKFFGYSVFVYAGTSER